MKRTIVAVLAMLALAQAAVAQLHVPVTYDLGVGKPIEGLITGGSICDPEGLSVVPDKATGPVILPYEEIDSVASMALGAGDQLTMQVKMRDGKTFPATAKVSEADPIVILKDELASGTPETAAKTRSFTKAGFRGIPLLEFEAALPDDLDLEEIRKMSDAMNKAMADGDLDKAIELYNQIGDQLQKASGQDREGDKE